MTKIQWYTMACQQLHERKERAEQYNKEQADAYAEALNKYWNALLDLIEQEEVA